jgi:spore maturation protein CgeB
VATTPEQHAVGSNELNPNKALQFRHYTILALGFAKWWGSDGRALAQAFRKLGHTLIELDEEDYVPWRWDGFLPKVSRRLLAPLWAKNYNEAVLRQAATSFYDFILVFKGSLLKPKTLRSLRQSGKPIFNFYPDTNFVDYGKNIPGALPWYDCVFTTKSFHGDSELRQFGIKKLHHVRHGFDPEVHRPVFVSGQLGQQYDCDVSFVGCWSPENEERILYIIKNRPNLCVRVFGLGWNQSSNEFKNRMQGNLRGGAFGDELAIIYCASRINLGLLRRAQSNQAIRDQTTARTFQIPATGSLMLHEDTTEVRGFFEDGSEVILFGSNEEMIEKIDFALMNPTACEEMRTAGYERCMHEQYDYSSAARDVINVFEQAQQD